MLTPPALADADIMACLGEWFGLRIQTVTFLPIGQDEYAAVYRVEAADGAAYFLKLRGGAFAEVSVVVPAWLRAQGIAAVMAPQPTTAGRLWGTAQGFTWLLYPFFAGANAYAVPLSDAQWVAFGRAMAAIHGGSLPPALAALVPRETYPPDLRARALALDARVAAGEFATPGDPATDLARVWLARRVEIHTIIARHAELGQTLAGRAEPIVLCHSDLHPANLLVAADGALAIVDWDAPILAPRERDLICLGGGGMSAAWDEPRAEALFRSGYGAAGADPLALAYYRYDRIVADLAEYGSQIFGQRGSVADREQGVRQMTGQFLPGDVIPAAHAIYARIG
jgi:spectinomycin phosphotransferase